MPLEPITLVTVPPFERNLSQFIDTDKSFKVTARNLDGATPTNITGWTATFTVHAYGDPNVVYFSKTVGTGITISNGLAGEMTIAVDDDDVDDLLPGQYEYRLERTNAGSEFVIGRGMYTLLQR